MPVWDHTRGKVKAISPHKAPTLHYTLLETVLKCLGVRDEIFKVEWEIEG